MASGTGTGNIEYSSKQMRERKRRLSDNGVVVSDKKVKVDSLTNELKKNINLQKVDFDLPLQCSVSHSTCDVYCCLQCGKYFQGRHQQSPAFQHSIASRKDSLAHNLYINLETRKFYWLPRNVQINPKGIDLLLQLQCCIRASFTTDKIRGFPILCHDIVDKREYTNGFIGINGNNHSSLHTDHISVIILQLAHINPIRDYFLLHQDGNGSRSELIDIVSLIIKRIWSPTLLRPHVSSSELIDHLMVKYNSVLLKGGHLYNPRTVLIWLINKLIQNNTEVSKVFMQSCQGQLRQQLESNRTKQISFWNLTLNLPRSSFFKDGRNVNDLLQVNLGALIKEKFYSIIANENDSTTYQMERLPKYLIIYFNRYDTAINNTIKEMFPIRNRNQTIVEFSTEMNLSNSITQSKLKYCYKLQSNVISQVKSNSDISKDDTNLWKIQLFNQKTKEWFEIHDIKCNKIDPELMFLKETYLQVWERSS